ncbi:MAG: hypothetical protein V3U02_12545 [Calditrichia bacterium]
MSFITEQTIEIKKIVTSLQTIEEKFETELERLDGVYDAVTEKLETFEYEDQPEDDPALLKRDLKLKKKQDEILEESAGIGEMESLINSIIESLEDGMAEYLYDES